MITSIGYERAISYGDLGVLNAYAGAEYSIFAADAFAVTAGTGDREVRVAPGRAYGKGIIDDSDAVETLTGAPVGTGSRWDMVVLRRTWSNVEGESGTQLVLVQGTATKQIPAGRQVDGGVLDDQPLFLVRFAAGQTAVQELEDLRVWAGSGGVSARSLMVRDYLTRIGSHVWINGSRWTLGFGSTGIPTWIESTSISWSSITGKPASFPSTVADVGGLQAALDQKQAAGSYVTRTPANAIQLRWDAGRIVGRIDSAVDSALLNTGDLGSIDAAINGRLSLGGGTVTGHIYLPNSVGASSGYTVSYINGDGRISRGTSSIRFKDQVVEVDPLLLGDLATQLHTFVMKDDPGRTTRYGNIAELLNEVDALRPFVVYERVTEYEQIEVVDRDGNVVGARDGEPISSHLARDAEGNPIPLSIDFLALHTAQIAQLYARLRVIEGALAGITSRLEALED